MRQKKNNNNDHLKKTEYLCKHKVKEKKMNAQNKYARLNKTGLKHILTKRRKKKEMIYIDFKMK